MAEKLSVNPNRMVLLKIKRRLSVARRGHKLLKDKFDELMKPFLATIKETGRIREEVETELEEAYKLFAIARVETSAVELDAALSQPKVSADVAVHRRNLVSLTVPEFELDLEGEFDCYGLASTPAMLDEALSRMREVLPRMVLLAQRENTIKMLAWEIEKTRRRVNALEYVLIPQLEETVRYITMKLDEFERANLNRLMKIKEMVGGGEI
ncbi:MAG: V-type ATP synthase subunit D [Actinobacteria bacterium]|nr:V-type ATP synthase subunit D [Actinomycetota bacterium]MBU1943328.1 V-type ATP synthase subunit D [Actinomycetota bacterium]MBU2686554.1 V-type ATP synthase subunit D [Actinomycetota bacterium]